MTQTFGSFSISSSTASRRASHMSLPFFSFAAATCNCPLRVLAAVCQVSMVKQAWVIGTASTTRRHKYIPALIQPGRRMLDIDDAQPLQHVGVERKQKSQLYPHVEEVAGREATDSSLKEHFC